MVMLDIWLQDSYLKSESRLIQMVFVPLVDSSSELRLKNWDLKLEKSLLKSESSFLNVERLSLELENTELVRGLANISSRKMVFV